MFGKKWCAQYFIIYDQLLKRIRRTLRRGKHRMILWPDREADGANESTTPSKIGTRDEMGRLEKVALLQPVV